MEVPKKRVFVTAFGGCYGSGVFDPCYFWPGSVYAGSGICFRVYTSASTFSNAQADCETEDASLAEVRTWQQRETARTLVSDVGEVWLGARNFETDTHLTWITDNQQVSPPSLWWSSPGVVNTTGQQDLVGLIMDSNLDLDIRARGECLKYICQRASDNPCDVFLAGGEYYDNTCYLAVNTSMTLPAAMDHCLSLGSAVVETRTQTIIDYITQFAGWKLETTDNLWLGLTPRDSASFQWQSTGGLVSTTNWASGGSGSSSLTADSAVVMTGNSSWSWEVVSQSGLAKVVCQRDLSGECAGVFSSGRCFTLHSGTTRWTSAKDACQALGSYLAEPKTEILVMTLEQYIEEFASGAYPIFLGATDLETEGTFLWDYSREEVTLNRWKNGEPNNKDGDEHVLIMKGSGNRWSDGEEERDDPHSYFCERYFPVYTESYVAVLPTENWGGSVDVFRAMISVASVPDHAGYSYIAISTFPTGDVVNTALFGSERFQYSIDHTGLQLNSSGVQEKYVRVRSTHTLDVHLFLWAAYNRFYSASLVMKELTPGMSSTYFVNPGQMDNSFAIVSTEEHPSTMNLALSVEEDQTVTFSLNGMESESRNIFVTSGTLPGQYQSLYVDSISGSTTGQLTHSTGALAMFRFFREFYDTSLDSTFDQVLPVSMIGSDYVTFPSLPKNENVTDHYIVVAVYSDTTITVNDPDPAVPPRIITLLWPGDVIDLELSSSGFYHVTGTNLFYLYARMARAESSNDRSGICSLSLFHAGLFRTSFQLTIVEPLVIMESIYLVVIVDQQVEEDIAVLSGDGRRMSTDSCQRVPETQWTGCYFHLTSVEVNEVYLIKTDPPTSSRFGAYYFSRRVKNKPVMMCFPLGVPDLQSDELNPAYDYTNYLNILRSKPLCDEETTTTISVPQTTTDPEDAASTRSPCLGVHVQLTNISLTQEQLEEALRRINADLSVNEEELSKTRRRKISAPDDRVSSTTMGVLGVTFIVVVTFLVIGLDISKLVLDCKLAVYYRMKR